MGEGDAVGEEVAASIAPENAPESRLMRPTAPLITPRRGLQEDPRTMAEVGAGGNRAIRRQVRQPARDLCSRLRARPYIRDSDPARHKPV